MKRKYSWFRRRMNDDEKPETLGRDYSNLVQPATLATMIVAQLTLIIFVEKEEWVVFVRECLSAPYLPIFVLLCVVVSLRLYQSIFLAKRDYSDVPGHLTLDLAAFLLVTLLASGLFVRFFVVSIEPGSQNSFLLFVSIMGTCFLYGAGHFYFLGYRRLRILGSPMDYSIELRIQTFNSLVCACLFFLSCVIVVIAAKVPYQIGWQSTDTLLASLLLAQVLLVILNIEHSEKLTKSPKFLLANYYENDPESKEPLTARREIMLFRARRGDVPRMSALLAHHFPYVFDYLAGKRTFDDNQASTALRVSFIRKLATAAFGLGSLGFLRFYKICSREGELIGFVKFQTPHQFSVVYRTLELCISGPQIFGFLVRNFSWQNAVSFLRRIFTLKGAVVFDQFQDELLIDYILLEPDLRRQGFGSSLIELVSAAASEGIDDFYPSRFRVIVRQQNADGLGFFGACGFDPLADDAMYDPALDPFCEYSQLDSNKVGPAVILVRHAS